MVEYVKVPGMDIQVSRIGVGTWAIGGWMWGGTHQELAVKALLKAFDMGLNLVDTAPVYGFGLSESTVGRALKEYGEKDRIAILFEREIEKDVLPYCEEKQILMLFYGAICRGLLSGKINKDSKFSGDDLRQIDPKFQEPRFSQYLRALEELNRFAQERYGKRVIHLAVRWLLEKSPLGVALWGVRKPEHLQDLPEVFGWKISQEDMQEIDRIIT